jgi:triacylglycerol lipase
MANAKNLSNPVKAEALRCINLSMNAYYGEYGHADLSFLDSPDIDKFKIEHDKTKVEGFFATAKDTLYVVFQGSNGITDWLSDLNFFKKKIKPYGNEDTDIEVHGGFYDQYQIVRDHIHININTKYKQYNKIVVTGHSLGSAVSVFCAIDLQYNYSFKNISMYGYGSPRTGNDAFVKSYRKRISNIYEFRYNSDIVTKVPYSWMGFNHINLIELDKNPDQGLDLRGWLMIDKIPLPCALFGGNWKDHYPERYLKAVQLIQ